MNTEKYFCQVHGSKIGENIEIRATSISSIKRKLRKEFLDGRIIGGGIIWEKQDVGFAVKASLWKPSTKSIYKVKN